MIDFNDPSRSALGVYRSHAGPALYKCPVCDTVVEVLESNGLEITCCGPEMVVLSEKVAAPHQPHALTVEKADGVIKVRVGNLRHPMEDGHHIAWIELVGEGQSYRQFLRPGDAPEAAFPAEGAKFVVRAYCSAHGLWRTHEGRRRSPRRLTAAICEGGPQRGATRQFAAAGRSRADALVLSNG